MRDTMGQAAHLTGGYGSSYGQAVGQQQYDAYLQKLGDAMPELYGAAFKRWQAEGEAMSDQLGHATALAQTSTAGRGQAQQAAEIEQKDYDALADRLQEPGGDHLQERLCAEQRRAERRRNEPGPGRRSAAGIPARKRQSREPFRRQYSPLSPLQRGMR